MDWRVEFGGVARKEIPEVPVEALREAVVNAFAHRTIESGQSVEIDVFRSFIDIISQGGFPPGVSPDMFIDGNLAPIRRNPLITRILYYSMDMESFATGLRRIRNLCDSENVSVEFECGTHYFRVRFHRRSTQIIGTQIGTQNGTQLLERKVLDLINADDRITRTEIAEQLGISVRSLQRLLNDMGRIHYVGRGRNGHWEISNRKTVHNVGLQRPAGP